MASAANRLATLQRHLQGCSTAPDEADLESSATSAAQISQRYVAVILIILNIPAHGHRHSRPTLQAMLLICRPTPGGGPGSLSVTDNRTGKRYEIQINDHGLVKANDLKQIRAGGDGTGLRTYDNG